MLSPDVLLVTWWMFRGDLKWVCQNLLPFRPFQVMWVCNQCRKQQEILTKSGEWFSGSGVRPGSLGTSLNNPATGGEAQRDRKLLRSRSQAPPSSTNANTGPPDGTHPPGGVTALKGADTMPGSRSQSEPPREKWDSSLFTTFASFHF